MNFRAVGDGTQHFRVNEAGIHADRVVRSLVGEQKVIEAGAADAILGSAHNAVREEHSVFRRDIAQEVREFLIVLQIAFIRLPGLSLNLVERRLGDIDVTLFNQLRHLTEEEREKQRADMGTVNVSIGHDDDTAVAEGFNIEIPVNAGSQSHNEVLFHVQDLASERQDGLELGVAAHLGGTACGVTLHQEQLALRGGRALGAVCKLARETAAVQRALTHHITGFAGCLSSFCRSDNLFAELLSDIRIFFQISREFGVDNLFNSRTDFTRHELILGLGAELRLRHLH